MHHSDDRIMDALIADEARRAAAIIGVQVIDLQPGDSAWNPASTKHDIHGPARLTYRRFQDGGVEVVVADLPATARTH